MAEEYLKRLMKRILSITIIAFLAVLLFGLYASLIHNQYFSGTARIARKIHIGDECKDSYDILNEYRDRRKSTNKVFLSKAPIGLRPEWSHKEGVATVIEMNDDSTPFDTIGYYIFCDSEGIVKETYFVGD